MAVPITPKHSFAELFTSFEQLDWSSAATQALGRADVVFVNDHNSDELVIVSGYSLFNWHLGKNLPDELVPKAVCITLDFDTDEFERLLGVLSLIGKATSCHLRSMNDLRVAVAEAVQLREDTARRKREKDSSSGDNTPGSP